MIFELRAGSLKKPKFDKNGDNQTGSGRHATL
jgi:hypothetical protein